MKEAFDLYQAEVMKGGRLYHLFVDDFLNSHHYTHRRDTYGMNQHKKDMHNMEKILKSRIDLVKRFFSTPALTRPIFEHLIELFYTTEAPPPNSLPVVVATISKSPSFDCCFDGIQLSLIAHCVNEAQLFADYINEGILRSLFDGTIENPLKSANNRLLAYFFDALCEQKLIANNWQRVIESSKQILSSASDKPLNHSQLASALNEAKGNPTSIHEVIRMYARQIKERKQNRG